MTRDRHKKLADQAAAALRRAGYKEGRQEMVPSMKVVSDAHRAANEASFRQSGLEHCAHQMAYLWPRNRFGSLLTQGEYEALLVQAAPPSSLTVERLAALLAEAPWLWPRPVEEIAAWLLWLLPKLGL